MKCGRPSSETPTTTSIDAKEPHATVYRDLLTLAVRRQSGQSMGTMSRTTGWVSSRDFQPDRINRSISS
jgi:hypothetical protein